MPDMIEADSSKRKRNPLFWIILIVIGLIAYIVLATERGNTTVVGTAPADNDDKNDELSGAIQRSLLVPPGMRARQFIAQLRVQGQPYPLDQVFAKANEYYNEGSLADSHLLYFFGAREGYAESMVKMAEMSDPNLFQPENSLLDHADALQSYKWYQKAAEQGHPDVSGRIQALQQWAQQESETGNPYARQLLLVVQ